MSDGPPEVQTVDDYLEHYGVVGMKWGVKRGNGNIAFAKGVRKVEKLNKRADKLKAKGLKKQYKGAKRFNQKKMVKGMKMTMKAAKLEKRAKKFEIQMAKNLSTVSVKSLTPDQKEAGKKYLHVLGQR